MFGRSFAASLALLALPLVGAARPADATTPAGALAVPPGIRIWTSHGDTYRRGEAVRVFFRTENDAYVTIFRVDTDGRVRILFPRDPSDPNRAHGGETYTVDDMGDGDAFIVDDYPGVGYVFAVASDDPFDYDALTASDHWSLQQVAYLSDGRIHGDPYSSLDDLAHHLMTDGYTDYDTHLLPYYVEQRYDYPRFLCYDCHAYVPYAYWNPYSHFCSRFSLFVYYDPYYFYPSYWYPTRYYGGTNVVYVRPRSIGSEYVFKAAGDRSVGTVVYRDRRGMGTQAPVDRGVRGVDLGGVGSVPAPGGRRTVPGAGGGGNGLQPPGGLPGRGEPGNNGRGGNDRGRGNGGGNDRGRGTDPVTPPGQRFIGSPDQGRTPASVPANKVLRGEPGAGRRATDAPIRSTSDPTWIVGPSRSAPDVNPESRPRGVYIDPGTRPAPNATPQSEARPRGGFIGQGAPSAPPGGGGERRAAPQGEPRYTAPPPAAAGGGGRYVPQRSAPPESRGYGAPSGGSAPRAQPQARPSAPRGGDSRPAARGGAPTLIRRRP